jgi:hypothetical protein
MPSRSLPSVDRIVHIPGHLALAALQYRLNFSQEQRPQVATPLLVASLFPDLVDKFIGYVWGVMPNGRHYAHNIFSLIGLSAMVTLVWGKMVGRAWFIGYLGHLLGDTQRLVPWFFPVKQYPFQAGRLRFNPAQLLKETIILALVLAVLRMSR